MSTFLHFLKQCFPNILFSVFRCNWLFTSCLLQRRRMKIKTRCKHELEVLGNEDQQVFLVWILPVYNQQLIVGTLPYKHPQIIMVRFYSTLETLSLGSHLNEKCILLSSWFRCRLQLLFTVCKVFQPIWFYSSSSIKFTSVTMAAYFLPVVVLAHSAVLSKKLGMLGASGYEQRNLGCIPTVDYHVYTLKLLLQEWEQTVGYIPFTETLGCYLNVHDKKGVIGRNQ